MTLLHHEELVRASPASRAAPDAGDAPTRIDAIDCVRGLVMALMLLDHTRDFTHATGLLYDPLDLARTTPALYATRWITHLCAPTFVFLAGTSSGIQRLRGASPAALSRFLLTRGLWFILMELTVVRVIVWWNVSPSLIAFLQVIWAIGVSMIVLAALVRVPGLSLRMIGVIGVAIVAGHNLLDAYQVPGFRGSEAPLPGAMDKLWIILHQAGAFPLDSFPGPFVLAMYPLIPWIGVLLAGYGFAELYATRGRADGSRRRSLFLVAAALLALFLALRLTNAYGDPRPWRPQDTAIKTVMSFLDVQKYGPSLLFTCITLFPGMVLLGVLDGRTLRSGVGGFFVTLGRVPFFYYLLQWLWAHIAGITTALLVGHGLAYLFATPFDPVAQTITAFGGPLWLTWLWWIAGVLVLYVPCRWFAAVKARRRDSVVLRYL